MKIRLLIFLGYSTLLFGCKKLVESPKEVCFIPYVDFVAQHVDPATLDVTFTAVTSYNGTINYYHWDFGDGTSFTGRIPPLHRYPPPAAGIGTTSYKIKYTVGNQCGEAFWTQDISIGGCLPDAKFTYSMINDSTVVFNNTTTSPTPVTVEWNFGDGTTLTSSAPTITKSFHQDQVFTVSLKATNSCGNNFFTAPVTICRPPVPAQTITITSCATVNINATASQNGGTYQWNFGNGVTLPATPSASPTITYTYPTGGTYTITLSVTNPTGCKTAQVSNPVTIAVNSLLPNNNFDYSSDDLDFHFTRPAVTNASGYLWNFGDGTTSTEQNPAKTFSNPGVYTLTLEASSACGSTTSSSVISVPYYKVLNNTPNTGFQDVKALSTQQLYFLGTNGKLYKSDTAGNWSSPINLPPSLSFNSNTRLFVDINNNLWIYGKNEIARYNVSSFAWNSYFNATGFSGGTTIRSIAVDNNGSLWTADDRQVRRGNNVISSGNGNEFASLAFAPTNNRIWITTVNKNVLYYANINGNNLNAVSVPGINDGAYEIKVHPNGDIYFITGTGIIRINSGGSLLNHYNISNTNGLLVSAPKSFDFDEKNNLWVIQNGRLLRIPINSSVGAKNYSFNADLNNIAAIDVLLISGTDTDILMAKTSGNVATKIR